MTTPYPMRQLRHAATKADPLGLTRREREVSDLLQWLSVADVARRLGIADATVVRHRKSIFRKLGVINRHEMRARLGFQALSQELSEPFSEDRHAWECDPRTFDDVSCGKSDESSVHSDQR